MPTLYQMIRDKISGKTEMGYPNPLSSDVGSVVLFDVLGLRNKHFVVQAIEYYLRKQVVRGHESWSGWTDYLLHCRPVEGEAESIRLRCHPDNPDFSLVLRIDDELPFNESLNDAMRTGAFEVFDDGKLSAVYERITAGTKEPYSCKVKNAARKDDVNIRNVELSDYHRDAFEDGQPFREYLFVEKDADTGYFWIYKGREVGTRKITAL